MRRILLGAILGAFGTAWVLEALPDPVERLLNGKLCEFAPMVCEASMGSETDEVTGSQEQNLSLQEGNFEDLSSPVVNPHVSCNCQKFEMPPGVASPEARTQEKVQTERWAKIELRREIIRSSLYKAATDADVPGTVVILPFSEGFKSRTV